MTTSEMKLERGRIVGSGMGGFLTPPGHPEHSKHVETDLRRRPENRGGMSLSAAVKCEWLNAVTRDSARRSLEDWEGQKLALEAPEVQDWIRHVLGYFKGCYRGAGDEPECWNASNLRIDANINPTFNAGIHAGVRLIRRYYPEFQPEADHFAEAYWGTR